jgi:tetratricopeptide (TPR) repeat protein
MWTAPDSSLAILNAVNSDSLSGDEDRAYHALLLTQAQFRCNIPLTSDTLINKAVDHYSDNHNREHYTRALLYKGGAHEDMNNPVEAMKYYKLAEENADSTDYRNLAQINMRLGDLYYDNYASNNLDLEKFKKALYYYEKLRDKHMVMISLMNAANVYRATDSEVAKKLYRRAELLAKEINDSNVIYQIYISYSFLCLNNSISLEEGKEFSKKAQEIAGTFKENSDYYILGDIYARLGKLDSAEYYLMQPVANKNTAFDDVVRYKCMMDIELAKSNISEYHRINRRYEHIVDSLEHNKNKYLLLEEEANFDKTESLNNKTKISILKNWVTWIALTLCTVFIVFTVLYLVKKHNTKKLIEELRKEHISKYNSLREDIDKLDNGFSRLMQSQIDVFEEIMASGYNPNKDPSDYKITHKIKAIDDSNINFWDGLRSYLNLRYDRLIDKIKKDYSILTDSDINFIGLLCCGFSDAAIAVCLGLRNSSSVRSRRRKIRDKMKIDGLLDIYLKQLMQHNTT